MIYSFPIIPEGSAGLSEVLDYIKDRTEFVIADRDDFIVLDYRVCLPDTFPAANPMRRECRGIKFYPDGTLAARPYHKFFNLGEKDETQPHNVNFNRDFDILDKLDGSMIHPIAIKKEIAFCTRMGMTDVAQRAYRFAAKEDNREFPMDCVFYFDFSREMIKRGLTPIFEWCGKSVKDRIVVKHERDDLILTAIRVNRTGEYLTRGKMETLAAPYMIPMVNVWPGTFAGINEFVEEANAQTDEEGYVIRFDNGHMIKIKNPWYLQIHKAKDHIAFEKNVIELLIDNNEDDLLPHLLDEDVVRLEEYKKDLWAKIEDNTLSMMTIVGLAKNATETMGLEEREAKKFFAQNTVAGYKEDLAVFKGILFQVWDGKDPRQVIIETIQKNLGPQTKVDNIRRLLPDVPWDDQ